MRHIVIGDIHGCYDVVSVGDIVRKGPAPDRCLDLWRTRGYRAVRGNQEEELLRIIDGDRRASKSDQTVVSRPDLVDYIRSLPVLLDLPAAGAAVVHGGMLPGKTVREHEAATTLRYVRRDGDRWLPVPKGREKRGDRFWAELWDGDRTVLYGHTPREEVRFDRKAIGLDTGCVYGGRLSAAVWADGRWRVVDVRARRNYARRAPWQRLRRWLRKMMPK